MKKILSLLLAVIIAATVFTALPITVNAVENAETAKIGALSGITGDCTWTLDDNGTLTISGNGDMGDYSEDAAPWREESVCDVIIENGVTSIGDAAFADCIFLSSITISDSVTRIGESAFIGCMSLSSITIPDSVTSIGDSAFALCENLESIIVPDSVTDIGIDAFHQTLWYENQPDGLIYIGKVAYVYKGEMPKNTSIVIKDGTKVIHSSCFYYCPGLTEVTIPDSVTYIGGAAFYWCSNLTSIIIPDSVTYIGGAAFYLCSNLTSIIIPDSITDIGPDPFEKTAWYDNQPNGLIYVGKVAYKYKGTMPKNTSIEIKDGTKRIATQAFDSCTGLKSVVIPSTVTDIDAYAFMGCSNLNSVTFSDGLVNIGFCSFDECKSLTSVTIPKSVISIENDAFGYYNDYVNYVTKKVNDFTIYGVKGSEAERYAADNEFIFIEMEPPATEPTTDDPVVPGITGDANGDGTVDILDAAAIQKFSVGKSELSVEQQQLADVNGDGIADILDSTEIQKYAAGKITEFKKKA